MDKVFREEYLMPIRHKEFNEFIKRTGFKGQNNYKLRDLKAMFGFKPIVTGSPATISSDELEPTRFELEPTRFELEPTRFEGFNYYRDTNVSLLYAKKNSRHQVRSNGKGCTIIYHQLKCQTVVLRRKLQIMEKEWEGVHVTKPLSVHLSEN